MTDELELLLDEEDEEAVVPPVFSGSTAFLKTQRLRKREESGLSVEETGEGTEEPAAWREELAGETAPVLETKTGNGETGAVYTALRRVRQAVEYRPVRRGEKIRLEKQSGSPSEGLDAAGLDRLFQRDARRYDGGFTWQ